MNICFKESNIEEGLNISNHTNRYNILVLILFSILQLFLHSNTSAYPILYKQPKFLCRNENEMNKFSKKCSKKEVCKDLIKDIDFIIDPHSPDSLIYELDLYCKNFEISVLESAIFVGPCISVFMTPLLISNLGPIKTMKFCGIFYVSFLILLQIGKTFLMIVFGMYGLFICTFTMYNCKSLYIVEMCDSKKRSLFYGILNINSGFSGIFVMLVMYYSNNIKNCFFINSIAIVLVLVLVHFNLVESIRFHFVSNRFDKIIKSLQKISLYNGPSDKLNEWLKGIQPSEVKLKEIEDVDDVTYKGKGKLYKKIKNTDQTGIPQKTKIHFNFISLLKFKSLLPTLMIFTFIIFIIKCSNVMLLLEIGHSKTKAEMVLFFIVDSITNIIAAYLIERPEIGRKKFSLFIMVSCAFSFMITFMANEFGYHIYGLNVINRIFVSGGLTVILLFNFESYPTLTRATSTSFNKFFGMFFNIFTPYLITKYRVYMQAFIGVFFAIAGILVLGLKETQGKTLDELPRELMDNSNDQFEINTI